MTDLFPDNTTGVREVAMNLSPLEIQSIIERSFLPSVCTCSLAPDQSLTIRVCDCMTGQVDLIATHVPLWKLDTVHGIATLVAEMRQQIESHKGVPPTIYH
jgi:hypothetical protein